VKSYCYYPGCCSCTGTGVAFGLSAQASTDALEMELIELEDWNCCGSTPYGSASELEAACIAARNLALAEKTGLDLVTPCSDCYIIFKKTNSRLKEYPDLMEKLKMLPGRVFTGKEHPSKKAQSVFFCYRLPRPDHSLAGDDDEHPWTEEAGETKWYLYDLNTETIYEEPSEIVNFIRSTPETPRVCRIEKQTLTDIRQKVEKHIKNTYLKRVQAPVGIQPKLKAWMELAER